MHEVLLNRLVKLAKEKSVAMCTGRPNVTIAVDWDVKYQTKYTYSFYTRPLRGF